MHNARRRFSFWNADRTAIECEGFESRGTFKALSWWDAASKQMKVTYGNGVTMLVSSRDDDFGKLQKPPGDVEGHLWRFGTYDPWLGEHG
jgi:hypothetical protein